MKPRKKRTGDQGGRQQGEQYNRAKKQLLLFSECLSDLDLSNYSFCCMCVMDPDNSR